MAKYELLRAVLRKTGNPMDRSVWVLITVLQGETTGTWYQILGGPVEQTAYELKIHTKEIDSPEVKSYKKVADIREEDVAVVEAVARGEAPRYSQKWDPYSKNGWPHPHPETGYVTDGSD
ncbi:hypothetical protein F4677DRAFT_447309 [Hypoxylon crocopeplum]|nr:hypothetical protein F4677DRAFT_447309 [Hypoxylon crocopeplum]